MIRSAQEGAVRRITLIGGAVSRDLLTALTDAEADPMTGAILIDAEGSRFCGALDFADSPPDEFFAERLAKPIVASMQGVALSAGVTLLANAHIVVAAQGSSFGLTDIREGRCDPRVNATIARVLGERRTRELALTGRIFTTPDALNWGLVHAAVPAFELDDRATAVAQGIARADRAAIKLVLERSHLSS
jgi:enoyl-CoA hydratase/carnithine racemase